MRTQGAGMDRLTDGHGAMGYGVQNLYGSEYAKYAVVDQRKQ